MTWDSRRPTIDRWLLDRYLAGECTPDEVARVRTWLECHPPQAARLHHDASGSSIGDVNGTATGSWADARVDDDWRVLQQRIAGVARQPGSEALAVPLTASPIHPARRRQGIDRAAPRPAWRRTLWAGVTAGVLAIGGFVLTNVWRSHVAPRGIDDARIEHTYVARNGERLKVTLIDGSEVILGPSSSLAVLERFGQRARHVTLTGEGFFTVASDASAPFVVTAGQARVRVLGTTFGVRHYQGEPAVTVAVRDGRVSVDAMRSAGRDVMRHATDIAESARASSPRIVAANDVARVSAEGMTVTHDASEVRDLLAWTQDRLVFTNAPLTEVLPELSRWYDVTFRVSDPSLDTLRVTGGFSRQSLVQLQHSLSVVLPIRVSRAGRVITLAPR
jgi:ferric-dicitrate binding protein FerR (iron transport regulator)